MVALRIKTLIGYIQIKYRGSPKKIGKINDKNSYNRVLTVYINHDIYKNFEIKKLWFTNNINMLKKHNICI